MNEIQQQVEHLSGLIREQVPEVKFAYLFGSAARDQLSAKSDIDMAVYLDDNSKKLEMHCLLVGMAGEVFPGREADITWLNVASPLLAFEALKGKILFIREESRPLHADFYTKTCRKSEEMRFLMKKQLIYRGYEVQWSD